MRKEPKQPLRHKYREISVLHLVTPSLLTAPSSSPSGKRVPAQFSSSASSEVSDYSGLIPDRRDRKQFSRYKGQCSIGIRSQIHREVLFGKSRIIPERMDIASRCSAGPCMERRVSNHRLNCTLNLAHCTLIQICVIPPIPCKICERPK